MYNFIIPYRDRKEHLDEFIKRFTSYTDATFYIIHQLHPGKFNSGDLMNIGFLSGSISFLTLDKCHVFDNLKNK